MHRSLVIALTILSTSAIAGPSPKVEVCHYSPDTNTYNVINVSSNAAATHLANHADVSPGTYYADADADGYGDADFATSACPADGYVLQAGDCDDSSAGVSPADAEVCGDGVDNDCDLQTDEECDPESICPCADYEAWSRLLRDGVPNGACTDAYADGGVAAGVTLPDGETNNLLVALGYMFCSAREANWNAIIEIYGTPEEMAACKSDVEAWAMSNGEVCYQ